MIPRREVKIMSREKMLTTQKQQYIQPPQIGGTKPPDIGQLVKEFLNNHRDLSQKIKNVLLEISAELQGVTDIIIAYRIIDTYIMKNTNQFITGKLKGLILYLARQLPGSGAPSMGMSSPVQPIMPQVAQAALVNRAI